jgi:hypothetical protein
MAFQLISENFPNLDQSAEGALVPFIFGVYPQHPALGAQVGLVDRLAVAMSDTDPPTGGFLTLSDIEIVTKLPQAGTVQIDQERISYTAKNNARRRLTGITRAAQGTAAAEHNINSSVTQVLGLFIYIVCENPSNHFTEAVTQVYLAGIPKDADDPPTHTINLNDTQLVEGHSFVTVTFDMSTIPPQKITPPPPIERRVRDRPVSNFLSRGSFRGGSQGFSGGFRPRPRNFASSGGGGGRLGGFARGGRRGSAFNPLGAAAAGRSVTLEVLGHRTGGPAAGSTTIFVWPTPALGEVQVDVTGLRDDSAGTITGTASTSLNRPMWIVRTLLREAWNERDDSQYNLTTFNQTHTAQVVAGLIWAVSFRGESFGSWRETARMNGRAELFNESGLWHYLWKDRGRSVSRVFTGEDLVGFPVVSFTPRNQLSTVLPVTFGVGRAQHGFSVNSGFRGRFGAQRLVELNLDYIFSETVAKQFAAFWLTEFERPHLVANVVTNWSGLDLELGDIFQLDHVAMDPYGRGHISFEIQDKAHLFAEGVIEFNGREVFPPSIRLSGRFTIRTVGVGEVQLSGLFAIAEQVSVSLTGTATITADLTVIP